jgi:hypothetical protein
MKPLIDQGTSDELDRLFVPIVAAVPCILLALLIPAPSPDLKAIFPILAGGLGGAGASASALWHRITHTFGWNAWSTHLLVGFVTGAFMGLFILALLGSVTLSYVAGGAALGTIGSGIFWLLRRPDKDIAARSQSLENDDDAAAEE